LRSIVRESGTAFTSIGSIRRRLCVFLIRPLGFASRKDKEVAHSRSHGHISMFADETTVNSTSITSTSYSDTDPCDAGVEPLRESAEIGDRRSQDPE
jgi:hypothetical protein